jgi:uncharacterized alkaline shock family protein YloU
MADQQTSSRSRGIDSQEFELPETLFSHNIENKVFQQVVLKVLSSISGIGFIKGNILQSLIGRHDRVKGISTEQDPQSHSIKIHIELNIHYGVSIPQKAEEIQTAVVEEITRMTGVRVSEILIHFKGLVEREKKNSPQEGGASPTIEEQVKPPLEEALNSSNRGVRMPQRHFFLLSLFLFFFVTILGGLVFFIPYNPGSGSNLISWFETDGALFAELFGLFFFLFGLYGIFAMIKKAIVKEVGKLNGPLKPK